MSNRDPTIGAVAATPALLLALGCSDLPTAALPAAEVPVTSAAVEAADVPDGLAAKRARVLLVPAAVAIEDAITRVLPALEAGGAIQDLEAALRELHGQLEKGRVEDHVESALIAVNGAIEAYQARVPEELKPDIAVIQLAVDFVATSDGESQLKKRSES